MPDFISSILRRSFAFRAIAKDKSQPNYDYAMGLAGSQSMFLVLEETADQLKNTARPDTPIRALIVVDTDYALEHVPS